MYSESRLIMENAKQRSSRKKILRNIFLITVFLIFLIYTILNIVFWHKGMPERYIKYEILENGTVEIEQYSGPFFLLNIPDTIEGKPVTSIGDQIFEESRFEDGKIVDTKHYVMKRFVAAVRLPDTVEEIHFAAFEGCKNLRTINIPSKLRYTGWNILAGTKVRELVFPEGITEIGCGYDYDLCYDKCHESFGNMQYLSKVVFPESLKKIGNNTFSYCPRLKEVTFPDSIEEMGYGAFQNSGLTEANIPKSLVNNSGRIFIGTPFEEALAEKTTGDFIIFNDVLLYMYIGDDENVVIPDGIESICDRAFCTGKSIKTVEIPESVRYINSGFDYSFVESLVIPDTVDTESYMSFSDCFDLKEIVLPEKMSKIPRSAFYNCVSLESIQLPKNTAVVESQAFCHCHALENIIIPESVEEIGSSAFSGCSALKKVIIPESVKEIGNNAFDRCSSLEEVVIEGSPLLGEDVFKDCPALEEKSGKEDITAHQ